MISTERLIQLRKNYAEKKYQTAASACVDVKTYSKWEHGDGNPNIDNLISLADHFHVSLDYLCGRDQARTKDAACVAEITGLDLDAAETLSQCKEKRWRTDNFFDFDERVILLLDFLLSRGSGSPAAQKALNAKLSLLENLYNFLVFSDIYETETGSHIQTFDKKGLPTANIAAADLDSAILLNITKYLQQLKPFANMYFEKVPTDSIRDYLSKIVENKHKINDCIKEEDLLITKFSTPAPDCLKSYREQYDSCILLENELRDKIENLESKLVRLYYNQLNDIGYMKNIRLNAEEKAVLKEIMNGKTMQNYRLMNGDVMVMQKQKPESKSKHTSLSNEMFPDAPMNVSDLPD